MLTLDLLHRQLPYRVPLEREMPPIDTCLICVITCDAKGGGLTGPARIGRVTFSNTGATLYYRGQAFRSRKGAGFKSNYFDVATGEDYWSSGPRRDGQDQLYVTNIPVHIDDDVREAYGREIRGVRKPECWCCPP